jgi:hypothetical protein
MNADTLETGDVIAGPDARVVRVAEVTALGDGNVRVRYTAPYIGIETAVPMSDEQDQFGYPGTKPFFVLARAVPPEAVQVTTGPPPAQVASVIDGGGP